MTEKQLLQQLKGLKTITLSEEIKKNNRDVLFSQIANTSVKTETPTKGSFFFNFKNVFSVFSQPLLIVAGVFVFIAGSLILTSGFYKNSKPNDSLYIARIISEKARVNTTFSQSEREALSLKFASDHAKEIATILMDPEFNTEENKAQVEKLNNSFKNEFSKVKNQIEKKSNDKVEDNLENPEEAVFSATSLIDEDGVEIYIKEEEISSEESKEEENVGKIELETSASSSTIDIDKATSSEEEVGLLEEEKVENLEDNLESDNNFKNSAEIIAEIEKLSDEGRYDEVLEKIIEMESSL